MILVCLIGGTALVNQPDQTPTSAGKSLSPAPTARRASFPPELSPARTVDAVPGLNGGELHQKFLAWAQALSISNQSALSQESLRTAITLARNRQRWFQDLIRTDPKSALDLAIPPEIAHKLPTEFSQLIETHVAGTGNLTLLGILPLDSGSKGNAYRRTVELDGASYDAFVYGRRLRQKSLRRVPLFGVASGTLLALAEDPVRIISSPEATALLTDGKVVWGEQICQVSGNSPVVGNIGTWVQSGRTILPMCQPAHAHLFKSRMLAAEGNLLGLGEWFSVDAQPSGNSHGTKSLLFIRVKFADDPTEPITEGDANKLMHQVNEYFVDVSYNTFSVNPTVTPLLQLPQVKASYQTNGPGALITDARMVARSMGLDTEEFDLDVVAHTSVPGENFTYAGLGVVGGKGTWLQSFTARVAAHEIGHNLGLLHANFWNTMGPPLVTVPPGSAGGYPENPVPYPFDGDGLVGHASIIGPGLDLEYGDVTDVMGSGEGHFNLVSKRYLHWIPDHHILTVQESRTNRIYALEADALSSGKMHGLRVLKDYERDYWIQYRTTGSAGSDPLAGVEILWNNWHQSIGESQLLDTTPNSANGSRDSALMLGRTFSDPVRGVHITPVENGAEGSALWMDVVVNLGLFESNQPPEIRLEVSSLEVSPDEIVTLESFVGDVDGDLVVIHWDMLDGRHLGNGRVFETSWSEPGDYIVRCVASDMKGGVASAYVVVRVGDPGTFRVSGRILNQNGEAMEGVRVHNGSLSKPFHAYSDSHGNYSLVGFSPTNYIIAAYAPGHQLMPLDIFNPVTILESDVEAINFIAFKTPAVGVLTTGAMNEGRPGSFVLQRTGSLNDPQTVVFRLFGTALLSNDFVLETRPVFLTNVTTSVAGLKTNVYDYHSVTFPRGSNRVELIVTPVQDQVFEGSENITLSLVVPVQDLRFIDRPNGTTIPIPGWELRNINNQPTWFQSDANYVLSPGQAEATIKIEDDEPVSATGVSVSAYVSTATERGGGAGAFQISRFGDLNRSLSVFYGITGTAAMGVDFNSVSNSVTFQTNQSTLLIQILPVSDGFIEGTETVILNLLAGDYRIGTGNAVVEILDDDLPTITVFPVQETIWEGGANGRALFVRNGDLSRDLKVNYLLSGTAVVGVDFSAPTGSVIIPAGEISTEIELAGINETVAEPVKTVVVFLSDSLTYNIGNPNAAHFRLFDDEISTVTLEPGNDYSEDDSSAPENPPAEPPVKKPGFILKRKGPADAALTVRMNWGGSAILQGDYAFLPGLVTFPAGVDSLDIFVDPVDDAIAEDPEFIIAEILPGTGYNIGDPYQAEVTIADNDIGETPGIGFSLPQSTSSRNAGVAHVYVLLSTNSSIGAASVDFRVTGGTAVEGLDYRIRGSTLTISNRVAAIPVELLAVEGRSSKTIVLALFEPGLDPDGNQLAMNAFFDVNRIHILTISDESLGRASLLALVNRTAEGGDVPAQVLVTRTGPLDRSMRVNFQVTGTASSGTDFISISNSVVIPAGTNQAVVSVVAIDDPTKEPEEWVRLRLTGVERGTVMEGEETATVFISDNDGPPEFREAAYYFQESSGQAVLTVVRSGHLETATSVQFETVQDSALDGEDFQRSTGTIHFSPGENAKAIQIPILNDSSGENSETFLVRLFNPAGGGLMGGQSEARVTILDDDTAFEFSSPAYRINENAGVASLQVRRLGVHSNSVSVQFETEDKTALDGVDYLAASGTIEFLPGEDSKTIDVRLIDDAIFEGEESFTLKLKISGAAFTNLTEVFIKDDETVVQFASTNISVLEHETVARVIVSRAGGTANPLKIHFETSSGSAVGGADFISRKGFVQLAGDSIRRSTDGDGVVEFLAGEIEKEITIPILNDDLGEGPEFFQIKLTLAESPTPGSSTNSSVVGPDNQATVLIIDNETPGFPDDGFRSEEGADGPVRSVSIANGQKILFAGDFSTYNSVALPRVGRLHGNGLVDTSFNPGTGPDGTVLSIVGTEDGKVLIGGAFSRMDGLERGGFARLNMDGTVDDSFGSIGTTGIVHVIKILSGGRIAAGGLFKQFGDEPRGGLALLDPDGNLLEELSSAGGGADGTILCLAEAPDGGLFLGGDFTTYNGEPFTFLVRINADGSIDRTFSARLLPDQAVHALCLDEEGRLYAGGRFSKWNKQETGGLIRLLPNGGLDTNFVARVQGSVNAVNLMGNDRVFLGGSFTNVNGKTVNRYTALALDGNFDPSFYYGVGADQTVLSVAAQQDGAMVIGGEFSMVDGFKKARFGRIHGDEKFSWPVVQFESRVIQAREDAGTVGVRVLRSGNLSGGFIVSYKSSDLSASAGSDYSSVQGLIEFTANEVEKLIEIPVFEDAISEGPERFSLTMQVSQGDARIGAAGITAIIIVDSGKSIQFSSGEISVAENSGAVRIEVERNGDISTLSQVDFRTEEGSAREGRDYSKRNGTVVFNPGEELKIIEIPIIDNSLNDLDREFSVRLLNAVGEHALSPPVVVRVRIVSDEIYPFVALVVEQTAGGTVLPGSESLVPRGSTVSLTANAAKGFVFERWEGTVGGGVNPFLVMMDRDQTIRAIFRTLIYTEDFESGNFERHGWEHGGNRNWTISTNASRPGRFSARSGRIKDFETSSLKLEHQTGDGYGSFDYQSSTEQGWDRLKFYIDRELVQDFGSNSGWQTFRFPVTPGNHLFEWVYTKDSSFSGGQDAVFLDNLYLPEKSGPAAVLMKISASSGGLELRAVVSGAGTFALEKSVNLTEWIEIETWTLTSPQEMLMQVQPSSTPTFYRTVRRQ